MSSTLKSLRALSDPTRLRIVALLEKDELSVNELQEITRMGQSRISTHLGLLLDSGLVESRREGKRTYYKLSSRANGEKEFIQLAFRGAKELSESSSDQINLKRILNRRREQAQLYFNQIAGRFDRVYGPGRSWQAFGHLLLRILPPLVVADLGSGEGLLSELLARRSKKVIAVDNSERRTISKTSNSVAATCKIHPLNRRALIWPFSARPCTTPKNRPKPSLPLTKCSNLVARS
jgi:DNA-binding transcriptional ArsR family regulator